MLNIVPADPFEDPISEAKLSVAPLQPTVPGPDKVAIIWASSPKQISWSTPTESCPKPIKGKQINIKNSFFIFYFCANLKKYCEYDFSLSKTNPQEVNNLMLTIFSFVTIAYNWFIFKAKNA